jgi:hypothetical protein
LNKRGLNIPSKRLVQEILVKVHKHDVIMVQETMGEGKKVVESLCKLFKEWDFLALDSLGNLGRILTGWKKKIPLCQSIILDASIWIEF